MEWPRSCRLAVALLTLLACRDAPAVATVLAAPGVVDVASLACSSMAREACLADQNVSGTPQDSVARASAHNGTERIDARKIARRNSRKTSKSYDQMPRIAVPHKHGFQAFVNVTDPNTERQKVTGYSIDVFKRAMEKLQHPPEYKFFVFNGTYDELVHNVSTGVYDAAVGDVTITAERVTDADFTMPYAQSGLSLLVLSENDSKPIQWIFLEPLTKELWFATVGGFFFTGFVVWMIERPRNPEYQGSSLRQFSNASYFAFSTLTFSHDQIIRSPLSKFVVVIWCFVVLVIVQSYTANLSSMLTAKRLRPLVTDLNQLARNGDYIGYQDGTFVRSFLKKEGVPEERIRAYKNQTEYAQALRKGSKNGGVSAILDEIPYLNYFLFDPQYKKEFGMVEPMYRTPGLGFVFPLGSPLVHNLSVAILDLTGGNEVSQIEETWLGRAALSTDDDSSIADSAPLTLRSFSGLFVVTGCVSAFMMLIRIATSVYARYTRIRGSALQNSDAEGGSVRLGESGALQDYMGNGDQRHNGDMSEHSLGVHGSRMSVEEPGEIHNGSVPADSVHFEMSTIGQGMGMAP